MRHGISFSGISAALTLSLAITSMAFAAPALFKIRDKSFSPQDLPAKAQQELFDSAIQHYERARKIAEDAAIDQWISMEAKRLNKPESEVSASIMKSTPPTDRETRQFYDKNKERIPAPYDQVKTQIAQLLQEQSRESAKSRVLADLAGRKIFTFSMTRPVAPEFAINTTGFAAVGTDKPKATMVIFTDFKCPHCSHFNEALKPVIKRYKDRVRFVFPDFPLRAGGPSEDIAVGAQCANIMGKFMEYHDLAFEKQTTLKDDAPLALARELRLDEKKWSTCFADSVPRDLVKRGRLEGERLGITGTPTVFINGQRVLFALETAAISAEIDRFLK